MGYKNKKIDPEKPLPKCYETEYSEISAKLMLEKFFPDRFVGLVAGVDKPDLCGEGMGVEVTSISPRYFREMVNLYSEDYSYGDSQQRQKAYKQIRKLGGKIEEQILVHPATNRNLNDLYVVLENKLKKLNKNYKIFDKNFLFIFSYVHIFSRDLAEILRLSTEIVSKYETGFDSVFLYYLGGSLYEFDLKGNRYFCIDCERYSVERLFVEARKIIESKHRLWRQ
ncbi:hypothetical protein IKT64_02870 [Candidatus Saccharibacteria bacterium]|nr:hypothetical protein [Candidatus Saccharibacteria bacterium]